MINQADVCFTDEDGGVACGDVGLESGDKDAVPNGGQRVEMAATRAPTAPSIGSVLPFSGPHPTHLSIPVLGLATELNK